MIYVYLDAPISSCISGADDGILVMNLVGWG